MKMAMAVRGKSTHYQWQKIQLRHWLSTAKACGFPADEMESIVKNLFGQMDDVIEHVQSILPQGFPEEVANSVFNGMKSVRSRFNTSL